MGRSKVLHGFLYGIHHRLPKIHPPFLHTTLRQKWGGGVCSNNQLVSCIRPHPHLVPCDVTCEVDSHDDCRSFLETRQLCSTCTMGISGTCADTKLRGIKTTCIASDDRGRPRVTMYCKQHTFYRILCNIRPPLLRLKVMWKGIYIYILSAHPLLWDCSLYWERQ